MLSEVINPARYDDPEWMDIHKDIETYSTDKHVFYTEAGHVYRKGWEWTHCLYGLSKLQCIHKDARALGVGAGREPVIFWLADKVRKVVATDIYGDATWSSNLGEEANAQILTDASSFCPRQDVPLDNVEFRYANGLDLPFEEGVFDFCWSLSSIEHFGGHKSAAAAVREMIRVLKPGGVACIATEFLLLPDYDHPEYFNQDQFQRYVIDASPDAKPVDTMSWELPPTEYLIDSIALPEGVHRRRRHVVLNDGSVQWTSAMVFLRKD